MLLRGCRWRLVVLRWLMCLMVWWCVCGWRMTDDTITIPTEIHSYLEHGWSLIPVRRRDKRPVGQWLHAQSQRANLADVVLWHDEGHNLAVVTGQLSGVVVVDCDSEDAVREVARRGMPVTPTAASGRGRHYFLRWEEPVRNRVQLGADIDIRGDGGYVIVPPSVHESGRRYRWVDGLSLGDVPLAPVPGWVLEQATDKTVDGVFERRPDDEWWMLFDEQVGSGGRNNRCAVLAGYLLRKWVAPGVVERLLLDWNRLHCDPPLSAGEVARTVRSVAQCEERRRDG